VKRRYLFRLDGSKENDDFFSRRCALGGIVAYSGTAMTIGPGWIPDLVEIDMDDDGIAFTITLIELEASEINAFISCRKYLPEPSTDIVRQFFAYLEAVMIQCKATADPRLDDIRSLRRALEGQVSIVIRAAGALRSSTEFVELHTLLDQPERMSIGATPSTVTGNEFDFTGTRSFSREETDGLRRTVRILHAVVTGHAHSNGTLHSWRNLRRKPLDIAVAKAKERFHQLAQLLENKSASGMRLDCDRIVVELVDLWSGSKVYRLTGADVADSVRRFVPISMGFSNQEVMRTVYDAARLLLMTTAMAHDAVQETATIRGSEPLTGLSEDPDDLQSIQGMQ
jgi:hypothetical protein